VQRNREQTSCHKWLTSGQRDFVFSRRCSINTAPFLVLFLRQRYGATNLAENMADDDGSSISSCESSDGSWTPSIGSGEDSDDEDEFVWKETPLQASRIHVIFDNLDDIMTQNYAEETAEIRRRIQREVVQLRAGVPGITRNDQVDHKMTGNEIFNAIFHTPLVYDFIAMMNLWLSQHNRQLTDYDEFQIII
jgi:hypothetical protein